jgi:hypothetical protein
VLNRVRKVSPTWARDEACRKAGCGKTARPV